MTAPPGGHQYIVAHGEGKVSAPHHLAQRQRRPPRACRRSRLLLLARRISRVRSRRASRTIAPEDLSYADAYDAYDPLCAASLRQLMARTAVSGAAERCTECGLGGGSLLRRGAGRAAPAVETTAMRSRVVDTGERETRPWRAR